MSIVAAAAAALDRRLLTTLWHALGVHDPRPPRGVDYYRAHFVTGPGGDDFAACRLLCERGLMVDRGPQEAMAGSHLFQVTAAGKAVASAALPPPPKLTRSQRRYREWLDTDGCCGRFGEWLKHRTYLAKAGLSP